MIIVPRTGLLDFGLSLVELRLAALDDRTQPQEIARIREFERPRRLIMGRMSVPTFPRVSPPPPSMRTIFPVRRHSPCFGLFDASSPSRSAPTC